MLKTKILKILLLLLVVILTFPKYNVFGQEKKVKRLSLEDVIRIAKQQSPDALLAKHRFRSSYWQYRTYKANYMPMLNLNANIPNFSRSIDKITLNDGSDIFIKRDLANSSLNMSLTQKIGFTGGQLFLNTNINRLDMFGDSTVTSYLTTPINIGFAQPIFGYNSYKWDREIAPLKYEEAKRKYLEDIEQISITATNYFFDMLLAQIKTKIEQINKANNDTLYKIAKGRYNLGTIAENDLLQLELSLLTSNANLENEKLNLKMKRFKLKSYLRIKDNEIIELIPPTKTINLIVDVQKAIAEAKNNSSDFIVFQRKILDEKRKVNQAKLENRFSANLYAVYGLTQKAGEWREAYKSPLDQEQLRFGIQVPILDWGLAKGKIKMAESNQELVKTSVEQQKIDFDQNIFLKVMKCNLQKNQLLIAAKSDTVAQKRYYVAKQRYLIGKISITELNIAQTEKDRARKNYISSLWNYWVNYFQIRKLTLYNFLNDKPIKFNFNDIK